VKEVLAVTMSYRKGIDFGFHVENDEIVIDVCEGITPEDGMAIFPNWMIKAALEES
jgi:hypothetical protein